MDLIFTLIIICVIGVKRVSDTSKGVLIGTPVVQEEVQFARIDVEQVPVGDNLCLQREEGAYMRIVREMGLCI